MIFSNWHSLEPRPNKEDILMVGDRPEDAECAQNAGINFIDAKLWRENVGQPRKPNLTDEQLTFLI